MKPDKSKRKNKMQIQHPVKLALYLENLETISQFQDN